MADLWRVADDGDGEASLVDEGGRLVLNVYVGHEGTSMPLNWDAAYDLESALRKWRDDQP